MFMAHSLAQQYLLGNATKALERLAASALAASIEGSLAAVGEAVAAMGDACAALRLAEGSGRWAGYFAHDRMVDVHHSRRLLAQLEAALNRTTAPPTRPICSCTGGVHNCSGSVPYSMCPDLFANQLPPNYDASAYPLLYRSSSTAATFDGVVRGGCTGACDTTPSGGIIRGTASAWLALPGGGLRGVIRYTLDGLAPTVASPRYTSAIALRGNATVTARAFGAAEGVVTPPSVFKFFTTGAARQVDLAVKSDDSPAHSSDGACSIVDYGAEDGAKTMSTAAIQKALDDARCSSVVVPAGQRFATGSVEFRHNDTTLLLEPRAQLVGAAVLGLERAFDEYPPVAPVPSSAGPEDSCRNPDRDDTFHRARALLFARNLRGIRIIGEEGSLIDGYGRPWYGCLLKIFRLSCALHAKGLQNRCQHKRSERSILQPGIVHATTPCLRSRQVTRPQRSAEMTSARHTARLRLEDPRRSSCSSATMCSSAESRSATRHSGRSGRLPAATSRSSECRSATPATVCGRLTSPKGATLATRTGSIQIPASR